MSGDDDNKSASAPPSSGPDEAQKPDRPLPAEGRVPADDADIGPGDQVTGDDEGDVGPSSRFFIVGIGASAGGLEALSSLLKNIKLDNMAFVVVQHLAPKHESFLPALLSRVSNIKVELATDGLKVEPNHVYVIPPNSDLAVLQGVLHVMTPPQNAAIHGPHLPVDYFFRSLAEDLGPRSIGIVLSGTGTDGTFGLKSIKEAGGITFAQEPSTAKYEGMPRSAVESGWADFCLGPEAVAEELQNISRHPYLSRAKPVPLQIQESVGKLIVLMRTAFGNDLTYYKPTTVDRRIERRMALHKIEKLADYIKFVQSNADELRLLYKDMLISVTSFFRDREPFETLKERIFPRILDHKEPGSHIRIWVPACSTGEEAYSIAICLLEFLGDRAPDYRLQIFGTDVDDNSIQHARRGVYPENIALDVSGERLQRFFIKKESEYQVARRVRDMVVFSTQNVTKDAPFSRLDLVTCRNLLIYLRPAMQKKVLRILHYALLPTGFLMLGSSETVGESSEYFSLIDRKNKIYTKRNVASMAALEFGFGVQSPDVLPALQPSAAQRSATNLAGLAERKILELYGPPGVVVNEELDIVHIRGRTGSYLEPMPGAPSFNILRLARPDLHVELRRALHEAKSTGGRVNVECRLVDEGKARTVEIEVVPVIEPETKTRCYLVLFHEPDPAKELAPPPTLGTPPEETAEDQRRQELERELLVTKEYLQSTIEELESANEELKSSNEELQSSNEELQSTNEELETSKEELQSSNEELTTVNDELQNRMGELQLTNDDLHNILGGIGEAIVIVGMDLRIRRYTHTAEKLFNLVPGDAGRSVSLLNSFITGQRIENLAAQVIERLAAVEMEVLCSDQNEYNLRITPYKTLDHSIKGVVISLVGAADASARKAGAPAPGHKTSAAAGAAANRSAKGDGRGNGKGNKTNNRKNNNSRPKPRKED
jgi:two-component system CheB/CheR fusion protein